MYFDGNDTINETTDLTFGTGAFTIEFWYQHVSDVNGGQAGAKGDIVISKGRRSTNYQGWVIFTHNNGTNQLKWSGFSVGGDSSVSYLLTANDTGRDLARDGDWHHIAVTRDGSGNMGMFVDGTRYAYETGFGGVVDNSAYKLKLASSYDYGGGTGQYANCYLYDVRITKGEAKYDPTSSSVTKPSAPFELNPVYIGGDQSGNKNHFTPTNLSSHDILRDTPTNNFCVLSPISGPPRSATISEGNLKVSGGYNGSYFMRVMGTVAVSSGKWFYEVRCGSNHTSTREYGFKGVNTYWPTGAYGLGGGSTSTLWATESEFAFSAYHQGVKFSNSSTPATNGTSWGSDGDVIGLALDLDSSPAL